MNLVVFVILVLLMAIMTSQVTGNCTDFCKRIECKPVIKSKCKGVFVPKGGVCGCCDACYDAIEPGQPCQRLDTNNPPKGLCKSGYFCDFGKCRPLLGG